MKRGNIQTLQAARHLLLLALLALTLTSNAASETFSVGIVPQFETQRIHATWQPLLDELKRRTGHTFVLNGSASIPEFEKQFSGGLFDFAYMNPYHLLQANNRQGYIPLVRDVDTPLSGILVVRRGTFKKVSELDGKTIAFPSPNALGATLMLKPDLDDRFRISYHPLYSKSHSSVYLNVLMGLAEAGGGVQKTLDQQPPKIRDGLEVIHRSGAIPSHPFCAHPRVPARIRKAVQQALLDLAATASGRALLAEVPVTRLGGATLEDYKPIARLGLERYYIQER